MENTEKHNTGRYNTGRCNAGDWNTGGNNTGHWNVGHRNTGNKNTGHNNTGSRNVGDSNAGSDNTGSWNTGSFNTGHFNTITPKEILVFNKPCSLDLWKKTKFPNWLFVNLTKWIKTDEMTDEEKEKNPSYMTTGGYLKAYPSLKQAYAEAWEKASKEDRELTFKLPNFDINVFREIFGFVPKIEKTKTITIDGKDIEVSGEVFDKISELIKQ